MTPGGRTFAQNAGIFNQYTTHKPKRAPPMYQKPLWKYENFSLGVRSKQIPGFLFKCRQPITDLSH
jgi:hypothetical protein